jgi:hypothetical protein
LGARSLARSARTAPSNRRGSSLHRCCPT